MTTYAPIYKAAIYAPRSIDPSEATVLTPIGGAPHSDKFLVATAAGISDALGSYKPYLITPTGRHGKIDVRNKTTDTGVMYFDLHDPQLPGADPLARWLPAFLGNVKGQLRGGGLLFRSWESLDGGAGFPAFFTGRLRTFEQLSPIRYRLGIRELTDDLQALAFVGLPHPDASYAAFASLLPVAGLSVPTSSPYGTLKTVPPLTGTIREAASVGTTVGLVFAMDKESRGRGDNIVTTNLMTAAYLNPKTQMFELADTGPAKVRIRRLDTSAVGYFKCWLSFNPPTGSVASGAVGPGTGDAATGNKNHRRVLAIGITPLASTEPGYMALAGLPISTGIAASTVEATILPDTQVSEDYPLFIGDVHPVTLWRHLLEGKFGFRWKTGEALPAGVLPGDPRLPIAYDAAEFAALESDTGRFPIPLRFQITKREPRGKWIEENILKATNLAFYLDADGKVVPIDLQTPTSVSGAPSIGDADLAQGAPRTWRYDRSQAITQVDAFYYEDVAQMAIITDLNADSAMFPTIGSGAKLQEREYFVPVRDLGNLDFGDSPMTMKLTGYRTMAGESLNGQDRAQVLRQAIVALATDTARPFGHSAATVVLSCRRGSNGDAQQGEIRRLNVKTVPDPNTNKLGGERIIRVIDRVERKAWVDITVMDLGLNTVANTPTIGAPAQESGNAAHGVTVSVTLNAQSDPVEVHYAVTATSVGTAPAAGSALWTTVGPEVRVTGSISFRGLPAGQRIWVRGRSFPDHRVSPQVPSAWVAAGGAGYVDLAAFSGPTFAFVSMASSRGFYINWNSAAGATGTEILMATPITDPRVVVARLASAGSQFGLPGTTGLVILPSTQYRIGVRHYFGNSVSAEYTVDFTTPSDGATPPDIELPHPPFLFN